MVQSRSNCSLGSYHLNCINCFVCGVAEAKVREHPFIGPTALQENNRQLLLEGQ